MAGGLNLYGYAGGDPVNDSDPFGLCCFAGVPRGLGSEISGSIQRSREELAARAVLRVLSAAHQEVIGQLTGNLVGAATTAAGRSAAGGTLYRFGRNSESAATLADQARRAESMPGFGHGVSVVDWQPTRQGASSASRAAVEAEFPVLRTGSSAGHHTVILPKPVTEEVATTFNRLFGRTP